MMPVGARTQEEGRRRDHILARHALVALDRISEACIGQAGDRPLTAALFRARPEQFVDRAPDPVEHGERSASISGK
jgi:hypothetical protein